jgi:hypothetical protein
MAHVSRYPHRRGPAPLPRPGWALEEEFREEIDEDDPDDPAEEEDEADQDRDDLPLCAARDLNLETRSTAFNAESAKTQSARRNQTRHHLSGE